MTDPQVGPSTAQRHFRPPPQPESLVAAIPTGHGSLSAAIPPLASHRESLARAVVAGRDLPACGAQNSSLI
jgi:hypothetical protein